MHVQVQIKHITCMVPIIHTRIINQRMKVQYDKSTLILHKYINFFNNTLYFAFIKPLQSNNIN